MVQAAGGDPAASGFVGRFHDRLRDEPLRSSLPAIFDGGVVTCPNGVQDCRPVFLTGAAPAGLVVHRRRPQRLARPVPTVLMAEPTPRNRPDLPPFQRP